MLRCMEEFPVLHQSSVLFLVALLLSACGAEPIAMPDQSAAPQLPMLTVKELYARTEAAMAGMQGYRMAGSLERMSDEDPQSGTMNRENTVSGGFRYVTEADGTE